MRFFSLEGSRINKVALARDGLLMTTQHDLCVLTVSTSHESCEGVREGVCATCAASPQHFL